LRDGRELSTAKSISSGIKNEDVLKESGSGHTRLSVDALVVSAIPSVSIFIIGIQKRSTPLFARGRRI
jgi:hypothetical protein